MIGFLTLGFGVDARDPAHDHRVDLGGRHDLPLKDEID
jgi:hypothetical protein